MKKIAVLLIVLIFAATLFAGCSVVKLAGGIQPDSVDMPYEENNDEIDEEPAVEEGSADSPTEIAETVIFEQNDIMVAALLLDMQGSGMGPEILMEVVNDSDADIGIHLMDGSVNGLMVFPEFDCEVSAGSTVQGTLYLPETSLSLYGVEDIAEIDMKFEVYYVEDMAPYFETEMFTLKTDSDYVQPMPEGGEQLFDTEGVRASYMGIGEEGAKIFIENNTSESIIVETGEVLLDSSVSDAFGSADISAGKKGYLIVPISGEAGEMSVGFSVRDYLMYEEIFSVPPVSITL